MVVGDLATAVEVLVLGGGPGGYVAAIRAAQLGRQVTLVTEGRPGGTCLNEGCIPAKSLLAATEQAARIEGLAAMGVLVDGARVDFPAMQAWKEGVADRLAGGVAQLLQSSKVEVVRGRAFFIGPRDLRVEGEHGSLRFRFLHCIIAAGAVAAPESGAISAQEALRLRQVPEAIAIDGSGYVAAELATIFARLGSKVTVDLKGAAFLHEFDPLAGRHVQARLKQLGVTFGPGPATAAVRVDTDGVRPNTGGLELKAAGVAVDQQGAIVVDNQQHTSAKDVYAVGDVTGGPLLATVAIAQGKVAAEALSGLKSAFAFRTVPRVAYTDPEVAQVGIGPARANELGLAVHVARFPFAANGRALTLNAGEGTAALVADAESGALLGVTLVGPHVADLIGEAALALEMGATAEDLALTLHPHPGLSEVLQEGAEALLDRAIHVRKGI
ncbi:MAG: FAD-dependent oxidoreductase [Firmicutes bacterium]|nr:FAD-dependent oxidoreductase [Bacillota bacterium]